MPMLFVEFSIQCASHLLQLAIVLSLRKTFAMGCRAFKNTPLSMN